MTRSRLVLASLVLGCGLLVLSLGLPACTSSENLCEQACKNYIAKCGLLSSSSSMTTGSCTQACQSSAGSNSGSSKASYDAMLKCIGNAKSCDEMQTLCGNN